MVTVGASPCWVALQSCGSEPWMTIARATSGGVDQGWEGWIIWGPAALCGVQCWKGPRAATEVPGPQPGHMRNVAQEEVGPGPCSPRAAKEAK